MLREMLIRLVCCLLPSVRGLEVPVRICGLLESIAACRYVRVAERLLRHDFAVSAVENMFWRFAASCSIIFFFELSRHSVVLTVLSDMAGILATDGAVRGPLAPSSSSAILLTAHSAAPVTAVGGLIEGFVLLIRRRP